MVGMVVAVGGGGRRLVAAVALVAAAVLAAAPLTQSNPPWTQTQSYYQPCDKMHFTPFCPSPYPGPDPGPLPLEKELYKCFRRFYGNSTSMIKFICDDGFVENVNCRDKYLGFVDGCLSMMPRPTPSPPPSSSVVGCMQACRGALGCCFASACRADRALPFCNFKRCDSDFGRCARSCLAIRPTPAEYPVLDQPQQSPPFPLPPCPPSADASPPAADPLQPAGSSALLAYACQLDLRECLQGNRDLNDCAQGYRTCLDGIYTLCGYSPPSTAAAAQPASSSASQACQDYLSSCGANVSGSGNCDRDYETCQWALGKYYLIVSPPATSPPSAPSDDPPLPPPSSQACLDYPKSCTANYGDPLRCDAETQMCLIALGIYYHIVSNSTAAAPPSSSPSAPSPSPDAAAPPSASPSAPSPSPDDPAASSTVAVPVTSSSGSGVALG